MRQLYIILNSFTLMSRPRLPMSIACVQSQAAAAATDTAVISHEHTSIEITSFCLIAYKLLYVGLQIYIVDMAALRHYRADMKPASDEITES